MIPAIGSNTIASSQFLCTGSTAVPLTGTTPTGGGGGYNYQWLRSLTGPTSGFNVIGGANSSGYSPGAYPFSAWYRRIVTTLNCFDTSSVVSITINPVISNNTIGSSQSICLGSIPSPLTGSTPTGGGGGYNYQWLISTTSATSGFSVITGATSNGYSPGTISVVTWFRRLVTTASCADTSTAIQITIGPAISSNTIGSAQVICSGATPAALTGSTPTGGSGTYSYQWVSSTTSATSGFTSISGATAIGYAPGVLTLTTWFRRVVSTFSCADSSVAVKITVNPLITNNSIASAQSVCVGFSAGALTGSAPTGGGGGYAFQWLKSTTSATSGFAVITGAISSGYAPGTLAVTTWFRRLVTTSTCADTSVAIKITINPLPVSNVQGPTPVCMGDTATYTDSLQANVIYSWTVIGGTLYSGAGTNIIRVIWPSGTSGIVSSDLSNSITNCYAASIKNVTIDPKPAVPVITKLDSLFSIIPVTGATYQWYFNGAIIPGATSTSYNADTTSGTYYVKLTRGSCSVNSAPVTYKHKVPPPPPGGLNADQVVRGLNIYPNPNSGLFTISANFLKATHVKLRISDALGRELLIMDEGIRIGGFSKIVDLTSMARGVYFVNVITDEGSMVKRIVIGN